MTFFGFELFRALVRSFDLQQGHLSPSYSMNRAQRVHRFWPSAYFDRNIVFAP